MSVAQSLPGLPEPAITGSSQAFRAAAAAELAEQAVVRQLVSELEIALPLRRWSFALRTASGTLLAPIGSGISDDCRPFEHELARIRAQRNTGAAICPTDSGDAMALVFSDARTTFGVLLLSRSHDTTFPLCEIAVLKAALWSGSQRLTQLRRQQRSPKLAVKGRSEPDVASPPETCFVLDTVLRPQYSIQTDDQLRGRPCPPHWPLGDRLPHVVEEAVRKLLDGDARDIVHPLSFLSVSLRRVDASAGRFTGVAIAAVSGDPTSSVAARYGISAREQEVLTLVSAGHAMREIGLRLFIAPRTVQDHITSMLHKTGSRNRSELITRVMTSG